MTMSDEVPIGPDEYAELLPAAPGRRLVTMNVGVRRGRVTGLRAFGGGAP
jgi:hypothetical protein